MKYILLFCGTMKDDEAWWGLPEEARTEAYARVGEWFRARGAKIEGGHQAPTWEQTDWLQIVLLYDALTRLAPSPVTRLNRAIALLHVRGPAAALMEVDQLGDALSGYRLLHATRAEILRNLGRMNDARRADRQALSLTGNPAERMLLQQRLN
ncbi:MAG TPA: hypothetical protein VFB34_10320 [Chloroflexota bacterium]|nr:hypothetical protein [Chloroflexota bacterium]